MTIFTQALEYCLVSLLLTFSLSASAGIIAHYDFNGNAQDSVGTNHGQLFGNTTFVAGYVNQAVAFDGNADWVRVDPIVGSMTNWSMTGYVYLNDTTYNQGEQRHSLFGEYSNVPSGETDNYIVHSDDPNVQGLAYDTFPPSGGATITPTPFDIERWYSIAIVRDNSNIFIYVDGALSASGLYEAYLGNTATVGAFGARLEDNNTVYEPNNPTKYSMNGYLDEVSFFNHSLSQSEVNVHVPVPTPASLLILALGALMIRFSQKWLLLSSRP